MPNDINEILRTFDANALAEKLCLITGFFHRQPHSNKVKPCFLAKRLNIQAACASGNFVFSTIEKKAEAKMSKGIRTFYKECVKTSKP